MIDRSGYGPDSQTSGAACSSQPAGTNSRQTTRGFLLPMPPPTAETDRTASTFTTPEQTLAPSPAAAADFAYDRETERDPPPSLPTNRECPAQGGGALIESQSHRTSAA